MSSFAQVIFICPLKLCSEFFPYDRCRFFIQIYDLQILSQWIVCIFILFNSVFGWAGVFKILMKFNLSACSFVYRAFGVALKKLLPHPRRLSPLFPFGDFRVLGFTFSSTIHCELIFIYGVRYDQN